jgi:hypothetical protein
MIRTTRPLLLSRSCARSPSSTTPTTRVEGKYHRVQHLQACLYLHTNRIGARLYGSRLKPAFTGCTCRKAALCNVLPTALRVIQAECFSNNYVSGAETASRGTVSVGCCEDSENILKISRTKRQKQGVFPPLRMVGDCCHLMAGKQCLARDWAVKQRFLHEMRLNSQDELE